MPENILVVEDDEDVAKITAIFLRARGYEVTLCNGGRAGLAAIAKRRPDCILLDIMMPEMSGIEMLKILRQSSDTATIPVILVTAKVRDDDVITGYQHGADYYITKPFTPDQLEYGIRMVLGQSAGAPAKS